MKISKAMLLQSFSGPAAALLITQMTNNARIILGALTITALTDNTTGTADGVLVKVPTQDVRYAGHVATVADRAPRAGFNTALGKINNALATLASYLNTWGGANLEIPLITLNNGTVTANTLAALDKTVAGTSGEAGDTALLRTEFNREVTIARNNLSVVLSAYNLLAIALGVPTLTDASGGSVTGLTGGEKKVLVNQGTAATVVLSSGITAASDLVSLVAVNATLTAFANDIADIAAKITNPLFHTANTLSKRVPTTLVP